MLISHSSKDKYKNCSYSWFLHYLLKIRPIKEGSALKFGAAIDPALNELLLTRDVNKAISVFEIEWNKFIKDENIKFSKSDLDESLIKNLSENATEFEKNWNSLNEKGKIILEEYSTQVLPKIKKVIEVQHNSQIDNETGDKLSIKPDLICEWEDGRILLVDNKTSSINYEKDSVKNSEQLATYYDILKDKYKIEACAYFVIPKRINKRKRPRIEIKFIIDNVNEDIIEQTYEDYRIVLDNIKEAKFEKNYDSCIGKYGKCCYFDYCRTGSKVGLKEKEII
jgi:hypothetical protein